MAVTKRKNLHAYERLKTRLRILETFSKRPTTTTTTFLNEAYKLSGFSRTVVRFE